MPTINGKEVVFKGKLTAKEWWPLLPKLVGLGAGNWLEVLDFDTVCKIVAGSVQSWEFDGDPSDPESVAGLDAFAELLPLLTEFSSLLPDRVTPKEPPPGIG